ncbi:MAG TPA: DNA-directed RNA polymerase subunit A'' [Candidatus Aenigmarchaeota archaeon]|nr:MAG: DNA-directed RNA polymerase subunit A'' [Candidatus Aenigmarchaeota archaeon]HDD46057.1 DNA-directed RNA polymerase subunit A'' [Candidatus Aenigmarchaeota archaeon]
MELPLKIVKEVEEYIKNNKIDKKRAEKIWERVREAYSNAVYDPEEPIGVVTAQSLSEPATQMTMRTYHFAGTAGIQVTLGLPRLIEIFDAKKEPETPSMTIYLKKDYQTKEKAMRIAEDIKEIKLKDLVISTTIDLINMTITCKLDMNKLRRYNIKPEELAKKIKLKNLEITTKEDRLIAVSTKEDVINLHKLKFRMLESHIKGVKGVTHVILSKNEKGEWVITTLGSNLKKVFDIEGVDATRTYTNNIFEVYEVLGIEAARNVIIREAMKTIEEQGLGVDVRYVSLLADLMTVTGKIRGIGRYGIAGNKDSVLARAAFEETKKHIINASVKGAKDPLKGPIENIILNQVIPLGTGAFKLVGRIGKKGK